MKDQHIIFMRRLTGVQSPFKSHWETKTKKQDCEIHITFQFSLATVMLTFYNGMHLHASICKLSRSKGRCSENLKGKWMKIPNAIHCCVVIFPLSLRNPRILFQPITYLKSLQKSTTQRKSLFPATGLVFFCKNYMIDLTGRLAD